MVAKKYKRNSCVTTYNKSKQMQTRAFLVLAVLGAELLVLSFGNWAARNAFLNGDSSDWESSAPVVPNRVQIPSRHWSYSAVLTAVGSQPRDQSYPVPGELPTRLTLPAANGQIDGTSSDLAPRAGTSLDKYGGAMQLKCAKGTGWFHTQNGGNLFGLCTHLGHV